MARKASKSHRKTPDTLLARVPPEVRMLIGGVGALGVLHYLGKKRRLLQGPVGDLALQAQVQVTQAVQERMRRALLGIGADLLPIRQQVTSPRQEPPARVIDAEFEILDPDSPV